MKHAKVFKSGNSQAIRLPKEFRFSSNEVEIFKQNGNIILREIPCYLSKAFDLLCQLPDDFYSEDRKDLPPQERDTF
jgi:antitoxin VapB